MLNRLFILAMLAGGIGAAGSTGAAQFVIDEFTIARNTQQNWFIDSFDDGNPPPNTPAQCTPICATALYSASGTLGPENVGNSGKLLLDGSGAIYNLGLLYNSPSLTEFARLGTNTDSANNTSGLKQSMTFAVSARLDTIVPQAGKNYGIRLDDRVSGVNGGLGNDIVDLRVRGQSSAPKIQYRHTDQLTNTQVSFELALDTGHAQIDLLLDHAATDSSVVYGRYRYVDGGTPGDWNSFGDTFSIFNGETYTRPAFIANFAAPVPEPESYVLMLVGSGLVGWQLRRKRLRAMKGRIA